MIDEEEWLDAEEWRELRESEAHLYNKLADAYGLDVKDNRDGEMLNIAYKLHVVSPGEPLPEPLPKPRRTRNVKPAQEANRQRGIQKLHAVTQAWQELSGPTKPNPTIKAVRWRASDLLGKDKKPLSHRRTSQLIYQMRAGGNTR